MTLHFTKCNKESRMCGVSLTNLEHSANPIHLAAMSEPTHPIMGVPFADARERLVRLLYGLVYLLPAPPTIENHQAIGAHCFLKLAGCRFRAHEREFLSVFHNLFYPLTVSIFNIYSFILSEISSAKRYNTMTTPTTFQPTYPGTPR